MSRAILAIDQGTTSSRCLVLGPDLSILGAAQQEFAQHYPASGRVEHDPEDLWRTVLETARAAMAKAGVTAVDIAAIGIANQRETVIVWERASGRAIHPAIVWQDRRTADICTQLKQAGAEPEITARTGLLLDPYFSGTKVKWLLDHVPGARDKAERGELAFGTVDSYLLFRLSKGRAHRTDATNASRTLLFNIHTQQWDAELCRALGVPLAMLPEVMDCAAAFGEADAEWFGKAVPVLGMAGDQQAALIGQACFEPGTMKSTYGTGCFALLNTGDRPVVSKARLLTTVAYRLAGKTTYALEGSIFVAGAAVQWLRDGLGIIGSAAEATERAARADPAQPVYLVPAFVGLGAPHWDSSARAALHGMTRNTGPNELARAALESVGYQTADLIDAIRRDGGLDGNVSLRVDGGMTASDWTMQFLADILPATVERPAMLETTALGAGYLAGWTAGLYPEPTAFGGTRAIDRVFKPQMAEDERTLKLAGWRDAVRRTLADR
ncbi:MAG: glycerol kinase GlpK [Beijerinckiaceae bacterium]|nr:glycerol kinase GlpK [Beijerinckiaceae bacterium]